MTTKTFIFDADFTVLRNLFTSLGKMDLVYSDPRYIGKNVSKYIVQYGSFSRMV